VPIRIIVNADDLGISLEVNESIFETILRGRITSATALANGPAIDRAAKDLRFFPDCSFGVHLNLTEFRPLSVGKTLGSILNDSRCFNGNAVREVKIDGPLLSGICREWCLQVEKLMRLGFRLSHLDSHHHVHTIPELLPVLAAIRRRYKIDKVRISRNLYGNGEHPSRVLLGKKKAFNLALRLLGFETTRTFSDFGTFMKLHSESPLACDSVELMTHPGSSLTREENQLLQSEWRSSLAYRFSLISYHEL
jgi:predicted glycoside hydrolase/deacetylase ChbG (UPF0249 family)